MLTEGQSMPTFTVQTAEGESFSNEDLAGKKTILYFYPKDDTPGCTKEGQGFSDALPEFNKKNITIYGISKCSPKKHQTFCNKYQFKHQLLSDENSNMCEAFGVWVEKSMYGRTYMGIERSTFLIDETGKILKIWRKVKVPNHVKDVLKSL